MAPTEIPISCIVGLDVYQEEAFRTAVFPPEIGPLYCAMGALGEAGELVEVLLDYYLKHITTDDVTADMHDIFMALERAVDACKEVERLKKLARKREMDLPQLPELDDEIKTRVQSEQGDCMWYQAGTAEVVGHKLSAIAQQNIKKLREQRAAKVLTSAGETIEERKKAQ
jgi:hypothetical protein